MSEFTEETGFSGYEPTTVDPGPSVLIATIIFCILSLAILPCLISFHNQCRRRRGENEESRATSTGRAHEPQPEALPEQSAIPEDKKSAGGSEIPVAVGTHDDASVASGSSSVARNVWNAILDGNPRSGPRPGRARSNMTTLHRKLRAQDPSQDWSPPSDAQSVGQTSVLSKLDHDEVSIRDAVDVIDESPVVGDKGNSNNGDEETDCCTSLLDSFMEIAEWDYEMKRICRLATPFIARELFKGGLEAVNVAIIGHFIGTPALSAYVTVDMVVGLSASLFSGFYESLATLCSQAIGARNKKLAGQYMQISIVFFVICYSPFIVFWMIYMEETLRWFGFDEETVRMGNDFSRIYVFVQIIDAVSESLHALLDTIGKESYSGLYVIFEEAVATTGILAVVLAPDGSLERVGLVLLFVSAGSMFLNVLIIMWKGWYDDFLGGIIGSCAIGNKKALKLMFKTASSLSLGYLLSYSEWEFLALFAQTLGPAEVVTHGLLGTLWDIVEMVSEATADAAEVRCAMLLGAGRPERAKLSAYKSIYLATFISLFISSVFFILGDDLPKWITSDPTLQRMLADLIPLFGFGNIALTLGTVSWTIVGSQGRYRLATVIGLMGSWFVTMPLAAVCTIVFDVDLRGQTAAVVVGYMVSGTANSYLLLTSDWEKLSREVIEANAEVESSSSSSSSDSDDDEDIPRYPTRDMGSLLVDREIPEADSENGEENGSLYGIDIHMRSK